MKYYLSITLLLVFVQCKSDCHHLDHNTLASRRLLGQEGLKQDIEKIINSKKLASMHPRYKAPQIVNSIINSQDASDVAFIILANKFGKDRILKQMPFEIHQIDNYWHVRGTFPKNYKGAGGTATIILNRNTCEVLYVTHSK